MEHTKHVSDLTGLSPLDLLHGVCPFMRLTDDLILQVLYRLPVKSVGRCALVSKTLNSLISDANFPNAHLQFSKKNKPPATLVLQRHNDISMLELQDYMDINKGVRLVGMEHQFSAMKHRIYECFLIGSCHGLLCIYLRRQFKLKFDEEMMFLWNPIIGKCQEIALPKQYGIVDLRENACSCWFGYLPSINEYKIFLSYTVSKPALYHRPIFVYSFSTSTWKEICDTDEVSRCFVMAGGAIFVNEALHCLSGQRWIFKFDLVEETFEKIPLSFDGADFLRKCHDISLGVIGKYDRLCVVLVDYHSGVMNLDSDEENEEPIEEKMNTEVWMLHEYGNWNSWKKWCGFEIGLKEVIFGCSFKVLDFIYGGLLCLQGEKGLMIIDPMSDPPSYAIACIGGCDKVRNSSNYVESLISPVDLL